MFKFVEKEIPEQNVSIDYVNSVEEKYAVTFPDVLRKCYTEYNMCQTKEVTFVMHKLEFCVEYILPLKYGTDNFENIVDVLNNKKYFPHHLIPFAKDIDGDYYHWDINTGRVYYVSMGNIDNPIPVARSVDEFFELLNIYCD